MKIGLKWVHMARYGAHIKTGKSPMAYDHFWTPPDPKMGHKNPKMIKKSKIQKKCMFFGPCCYPPLVGLLVLNGPQHDQFASLIQLKPTVH